MFLGRGWHQLEVHVHVLDGGLVDELVGLLEPLHLMIRRLLVNNQVGIVDLIIELAVEVVPLHLEVAV